jgi:hypothetical protein
MVIGDEYALTRRRDYLRATVLETDPEVCGRGWVRVRLEGGISAGEETRVSSRRIFARWEEREDPPPRRVPNPRPVVVRGPWPPEPGKPIFWHKTGEIRWMVEKVDRRNRMATITGELVGQRQRHTLSWVELRQFEARIASDSGAESDHKRVGPELARLEAVDREPEPPVRKRERLAEVEAAIEVAGPLECFVARLVFSPEALERYRRRFVKSASLAEAHRRLYEELYRRGKLFRRSFRAPGASKEYLRIRVKGRFDVVLRERPDEDAAIYISEQDVRIVSTRRKQRRTTEPAESSGKRAA